MNKATTVKHSGNTDLPLWLRISFLADAEATCSHTFPDGSIFTPETPEAWFKDGELSRRFGRWVNDDVDPLPAREITKAIKVAVEKGFLWADSEPTCLKPRVC